MNGYILKKIISDGGWTWKILNSLEGTSADQN